jgi:hypothetical protein
MPLAIAAFLFSEIAGEKNAAETAAFLFLL